MKQAIALRIAAAATAGAALSLILSVAGSAASKPKALSSFDPQVKALLSRMTLDEKIGQMTQPEQKDLKDPADIENYFVGSLSERRRFRPQGRQQPQGLDRPLRPPPGAHPQDPPRDPAALRHRRRPRPQQRARRRDLPAQHRPRLHAQSRAGREDRAHHRRGGPRHRHPVDLRALRHRAPGHPLGPHLRRLLGRSRAGARTRRGRRPRLPGRRPRRPALRARLRQALRGRRRHRLRLHASGTGLDQGDTRVDEATLRRIHLPGYLTAIRPASAPSCRPTAVGTA